MSDQTVQLPTHYKHSRTYIVDQNTTKDNHLVRGNLPLEDDGSFAWTKLNAQLQTLLGTSFDLGDYTFIDVTLIDNSDEGTSFDAELAVFGIDPGAPENKWCTLWPPYYRYNLPENQNKGFDIKKIHGTEISGDKSHKGGLVWWPVQPCDGSTSDCKNIAVNQFAFPDLIKYLNTLLNTEEKTIIYYHCMHGHDRTSAVTASYLTKYKESQLAAAFKNDEIQVAKDLKTETGQKLMDAEDKKAKMAPYIKDNEGPLYVALYDPPPAGAYIDGFEWEGTYPDTVKWYYTTYVKSQNS